MFPLPTGLDIEKLLEQGVMGGHLVGLGSHRFCHRLGDQ